MNRVANKFLYNTVLAARGEWFYTSYKYLLRSQWLNRQAIESCQEEKLDRLIRASKSSTYYKKVLPSKVDLTTLHHLPFVDKQLLRNNAEQLRAQPSCFDRKKTTGGSTGAAVTLYKNPRAMAEELAATWRGYSWANVFVGDKQARFWGVPISEKDRKRSQLVDFIGNRTRISAFSRDDSAWEKALLQMESFNPDYFYGYVSIIKEFAEFVEKRGHTLKPKAVIPTSEVLTAADKEKIGAIFQCPVFNEYGCGEVGTIAHECEHGSLHINVENMIVEIVDNEGNPVPAGHPGEIVVTDLSNTAMPLIRYKMADWGSLSTNKCSCGRSLPILGKIYGRAYDSLVNTSGMKYHGEFFLYMIEDANKIGIKVDGVQFIQDSSDTIHVKLVCSQNNFAAINDYLKIRFHNDFDKHIKIACFKVKEIEREKSGKLRVVKRQC